ncbi:hypothetical protein JTB14_018788 [Gonioctena quinquepunctata]|nr:hypothetical protein JTB14_018788 [Gonioctena quinquepunctata]
MDYGKESSFRSDRKANRSTEETFNDQSTCSVSDDDRNFDSLSDDETVENDNNGRANIKRVRKKTNPIKSQSEEEYSEKKINKNPG